MERATPFGKYFLLERINVGGMAEVFKAKTVGVEGFEKLVAIKRILPSVAEDEDFIKMFVDEAKITSQLSHANLAQTFDLGRINETYYIAMEYVPGKDLRAVFERLKRRGDKMPLPLVAYVMARVCEGLDYAHRKRDPRGEALGIVHRDVSPQNVIVSFEGEVKLIDFGIAKAANKITKTQAGILKGKFGYMSPEQVRGLPLDRRSDIFAAGVVLYELCTGERLFTGSSDFSVLEKVQAAKIQPPSLIEPQIPLKLERVILKALAREPEDRYQHAADLASDLTRFLIESQPRNVSRDNLAAFMKETFPDDSAREHAAQDMTKTRAPRRPPPVLHEEPRERGRAEPPRLPPSLTADLDPLLEAEMQAGGEPAWSTEPGAPRPSATTPQPRTNPVQPSPPSVQVAPGTTTTPSRPALPPPPALAPTGSLLPPLPTLPPLASQSQRPAQPAAPPPATVAQPAATDLTDPGFAGDQPTRPMSMDELARAERAFIERQRGAPSLAEPTVQVAEEDTGPRMFVDKTQPSTERPVHPPPAAEAPARPAAQAAAAKQVATQPAPPASAPAKKEPAKKEPAPRAETQRPAGAVSSAPSVPAPLPAHAPASRYAPPAAAPLAPAAPAPAQQPDAPARSEPPARGRSKPPPLLPSSLLADTAEELSDEDKTEPGIFLEPPGSTPAPRPATVQPRAALRDDKSAEITAPRGEAAREAPATRPLRGTGLSRPPERRANPFGAAPRESRPPTSRAAGNGAAPSRPPQRQPEKLPPYEGRMQVSRPTLVGDDPLPPEESTVSTLTRRARWVRRGQLLLLAGALGVALWAWLSVPHGKKEVAAAPPSGSITVGTDPEDALILLDGRQVKEALDRDWTEPRLAASVEHVLTVRREGFVEQVQAVKLVAGEQKVLRITLQPLPGQLTVRSSPSGAQVFLDGQKRGTTPAYLPDVDPAQAHAIVLEKHCFRPWQVAVSAHAGRREVAATLEPVPGACMGQRFAPEEKPAPQVPLDDPAAMATLGFLSLGSRPSANVFIDGVDIGRTTPLLAWPLKVGRHGIRLMVLGKKKEFPVDILSGQTHSEIIDLRKK